MDLKALFFGKGRTDLGRFVGARHDLHKLTGSLNSALFLSQVAFWWYANGRRPFYKFNSPCPHPLCREGDTWADELPLGKDAFGRARRQVAAKITTGSSKNDARQSALVLYWTDSNRVTWYELNEALLVKWIKARLGVDKSAPKEEKQIYLESGESSGTSSSEQTTEVMGNDWEKAFKAFLAEKMTRATFDTHIRGMRIAAWEEGSVTLRAPAASLDWLRGRLRPQIETALASIQGRAVAVVFEG